MAIVNIEVKQKIWDICKEQKACYSCQSCKKDLCCHHYEVLMCYKPSLHFYYNSNSSDDFVLCPDCYTSNMKIFAELEKNIQIMYENKMNELFKE